MKILVTGGSGFIGTHLVGELLKAKHSITIFDKNNSCKYPELVTIGDVRNKDELIKIAAGHNVIYHLAAAHADDVRPVSLYYEVNVGGAKNLIDAADNAGINKIIFTSSVAVYPLNAGQPDEDMKVAPFNKYGKSKYAAEQVFTEWAARNNEHSLTIVRPCVIFGEENRGNVYNLLSQISKKNFIMVGHGQNKKSMAYVGNIAAFLKSCLSTGPECKLVNFADKPDLTTGQIVAIAGNAFGGNGSTTFHIPYMIGLCAGYAFDLIAWFSGKSFPVSSIRIKKFCADTTISTNRLLETGFKSPCTLKQALEQTIKAEFPLQGG